MEEKTIHIDMNNVVHDKENQKRTDSNRTNIFNSTKFGVLNELPLPEPSGLVRIHEGKLKRIWRKRGRLILCVLLLVFFLANIVFDLYQIQNSQASRKQATSDQISYSDDAIYEEEVLNFDDDSDNGSEHHASIKDILSKMNISPDHLQLQEDIGLNNNQDDDLNHSVPPLQQPLQVKCQRTLTSSEITLDSNGIFCNVQDVNLVTNCCTQEIQQEQLDCDSNINCCADQPHCVASCMRTLGLSFGECLEDCRISSSEINHNRYYNDRIYKYCYSDSLPSNYSITLSNLNENCDQACGALDLQCDPRYLQYVNTCQVLNEHFECSQCYQSFNSFAPSLKISKTDNKSIDQSEILSGDCLISSYQMLFNCDNKSPEHKRICSCVKFEHQHLGH